MLISKLPKDIQKLALRRRNEQGRDEVKFNDDLGQAIVWLGTPEGHHFWKSLNEAEHFGVMATNIRLKEK